MFPLGATGTHLRKANQHQQSEDVGVLQLEGQLLDAVVSESSNDTVPLRRGVQRAQDVGHGARPVQPHTTAKQEQAALGGLTAGSPEAVLPQESTSLVICHSCSFQINTEPFFRILEAFIPADT